MMQNFVIGVDISKERLDVFVGPQRQHLAIPNTPAGRRHLAALAGELAAAGEAPVVEAPVVFETTSIHDRMLGGALAQAGIAHARVNPRRARDALRSHGMTVCVARDVVRPRSPELQILAPPR